LSIGHRSTLTALHHRHINMREGGDGLFQPIDVRAAVPAQ